MVQSFRFQFPIFKFKADTENILWEDQDDESREEKRSMVANILYKEKYKNPVDDPIKAEIISIHKRTKKFLNLNKDLVITSADKDNITVVMRKSEYHRKMMEYLSDTKVYQELQFGTTELLHARSVYIANTLKKQQFITEKEYNKLVMHNSSALKVYGQPKVHMRGKPITTNCCQLWV